MNSLTQPAVQGVLTLQASDLAIAASLVALSALISLGLRLRMERSILWAAARTVVQLLLVGHILRVVFANAAPWLTTIVVLIMMGLAAREVAARPAERLSAAGASARWPWSAPRRSPRSSFSAPRCGPIPGMTRGI